MSEEQYKATEQQQACIRKLCQYTNTDGAADLEQLGYYAAKAMIKELTAKYKAMPVRKVIDVP